MASTVSPKTDCFFFFSIILIDSNIKLLLKSTSHLKKSKKFCPTFRKSLSEKLSSNWRDKLQVIATLREKVWSWVATENFKKIRRKVLMRTVLLLRTPIYRTTSWLGVRINLTVIWNGKFHLSLWSQKEWGRYHEQFYCFSICKSILYLDKFNRMIFIGHLNKELVYLLG